MRTNNHDRDQLISRKARIIGRTASGLAGAFLLWDSVIKLLVIAPVVESFARLGFPPGAARAIGVLELACVALYLIPRTAALGAVILTGFLGGAVAIHVRVGDPLLSHALFPVYVAVVVWGGLLARHRQLRVLGLALVAGGAGPGQAETTTVPAPRPSAAAPRT